MQRRVADVDIEEAVNGYLRCKLSYSESGRGGRSQMSVPSNTLRFSTVPMGGC